MFGKIRYMNLAGCKRKFDVEKYVARVNAMIRQAKADKVAAAAPAIAAKK